MDIADLQKLAQRTRSGREIGIALVITSCLLGLLLLIPLGKKTETAPVTTTATSTSAIPDAFAQVPLEAKAAIVYDLSTNKILYAKNSNAQLPLASLTKLLTVYAALRELSPNTPITITADATRLSAPSAFSAGQIFTLSDLARLTLTASLNDGAAAIASATAARQNRSQSAMLASAAAALGLSQTYAVNGSGLDVNYAISGGYGSAYDLARLAGALVAQAPIIAEATTNSSAQAVSKGGASFVVKNTDPMIGTIPRLLLSKTGYTDLAGGNLAIVFDSGIQHPIAIIVLGSSQKARFTDGTALVAATFAHFAGVASL
ncbi:MAG: serine hydrolase [Candidatus Kaiserbacteria bacterium]|nr:serine hydrolase [Candidatus Kaiserbacteria bacterium]